MALQKVTSQFPRERHYVTDLKIHLVCVTKYCRFVFTKESLELQLFRRFRRWCAFRYAKRICQKSTKALLEERGLHPILLVTLKTFDNGTEKI
jgi:hypothetical protein